MKAIVSTCKTLIGLFFDDGRLALGIVALLVAMAVLAKTSLVTSPIAIVPLAGGTLVLLVENVVRAARLRTR